MDFKELHGVVDGRLASLDGVHIENWLAANWQILWGTKFKEVITILSYCCVVGNRRKGDHTGLLWSLESTANKNNILKCGSHSQIILNFKLPWEDVD